MKHLTEISTEADDMTPLSVSVIVPCYNGERALPATLTSLLSQTQLPDEIIVVDDGSRDASVRVAESFGDRVRVIRQANAGAAIARHMGVLHARTQVVVFNDAGDVSRPNRVESLVRALTTHPECMAAFGVTWIKSRPEPSVSRLTGGALDGSLTVITDPFESMLAQSRPIAIGMNLAIRREVALTSTQISPFYRAANDYALQINTARSGPFVHVADTLLEYEETEGGISNQNGWIQQTGYSLCAAAEFFLLESEIRKVPTEAFVDRVSRDWPGVALYTHLRGNNALLKRVIYVGLRYGRLRSAPRRLWWALDEARARGLLEGKRPLHYLAQLLQRLRRVE